LHEQNKALRQKANAVAFLNSAGRATLSSARRATNSSKETVVGKPERRAEDSVALPAAAAVQPKDAGADVPCPTGDCPPATLNLLCQRHPSIGESPSAQNYNGRYASNVIFKFSSLDKETVDEVLAAANINLNGSAATVAA